MCWTQGKPDKLKYLKLAKMWYLTEQCSPLDAFIVNKQGAAGAVYRDMKKTYMLTEVRSKSKSIHEKQSVLWAHMGSKCCMSMPGAP